MPGLDYTHIMPCVVYVHFILALTASSDDNNTIIYIIVVVAAVVIVGVLVMIVSCVLCVLKRRRSEQCVNLQLLRMDRFFLYRKEIGDISL